MILRSLRLSGLMMLRDWRAGELRFLLVALIVAVTALSSVGFFVDRMRAGMARDAHQLLGADVLIVADQPIDSAWRDEAQRHGLAMASTVVFPSMAIAGEGDASRAQLASVKAVTPGYPLRGTLKVSDQAGGKELVTRQIPAAGTVWLDQSLLSALDLARGDVLQLGDRKLTVAEVLSTEPDRGSGFINFAPRVMLSMDDLASTNLIQNGSRVTYRLLLAGEPRQVQDFQKWVESVIARDSLRGVRVETLDNARPEMRVTFDRGQQFLSLVSLLSAMLAAAAVAMAARRFMLRHLDACAMLRCLGMTQGQVTWLYLLEFLLLGLLGSVIGVLIGFGVHFILLTLLGQFFPGDLPAASAIPAVQGIATGLLLLIGFALPPILQLRNVPHNRVMRREQDPPQVMVLSTYGVGALVFTSLLLWQAGEVKLGVLTALGFLGACTVFFLMSWLALKSLRFLREILLHASWRFALTGLQRRPGMTIIQIMALALGLMALLLLAMMRGDLIDAWRQATPADAPNHFVINIQPDQRAEIAKRLMTVGVQPELYPMIRGRLTQINGKSITAKTYSDDRAQRLVEREFNLSTMHDIPPQNKLVAGAWYRDQQPEASVEEGLANTLHLKLGDQLQFDIAGQIVTAPITSLRKLEWGSLRVNFFVILNPRMMRDMPQTWVTAFNLPVAQMPFIHQLSKDFPNLTVVDVGHVIKQIQGVIEQVVVAVEFLFLFTLISGVLVLYAALLGSQAERTREAGLLRALGATRKQLAQAQWVECALIGSLAGFLATSGAAVIGWVLAHYVFDFNWVFSPFVWLCGISIGIVCTLIGGWIGLRNVVNQPPLQTLREA